MLMQFRAVLEQGAALRYAWAAGKPVRTRHRLFQHGHVWAVYDRDVDRDQPEFAEVAGFPPIGAAGRWIRHHKTAADSEKRGRALGRGGGRAEAPGCHYIERATQRVIMTSDFGPLVQYPHAGEQA